MDDISSEPHADPAAFFAHYERVKVRLGTAYQTVIPSFDPAAAAEARRETRVKALCIAPSLVASGSAAVDALNTFVEEVSSAQRRARKSLTLNERARPFGRCSRIRYVNGSANALLPTRGHFRTYMLSNPCLPPAVHRDTKTTHARRAQ